MPIQNKEATLIDQLGNKRVAPAQGAEFKAGERLMTPEVNAEIGRMKKSTGKIGDPATGQTILTASSPEVKAEMSQYPQISIDSAIGNVLNRQKQAQKGGVSKKEATIDPTVDPKGTVDPAGGNGAGSGGKYDGYNDKISSLMQQYTSPQEIQSNLDSSIEEINKRYSDLAISNQQKSESKTAGALSSLAQVGVNPLSSGAGSVATRQELVLNDINKKNESLRLAEIARAKATAQGMRTDAIDRQIEALKDERDFLVDRDDEEYNRAREASIDAMNNLNTSLNMLKTKKSMAKSEREEVKDNIYTLYDTLGGEAFKDLNDKEIRDLEQGAGLPFGTITQLKSKKQEAEMPELRTIGGNLYSLSIDEYGNVVPELIVSKSTGGGSSSSSSSGSYETPDGEVKLPSNFFKRIDAGKTDLQQGEDWGNVWNRIKNEFPDVPNEVIDENLGTSWREYGAYQEFKAKGRASNAPVDSSADNEYDTYVRRFKEQGYSREETEKMIKEDSENGKLHSVYKISLDKVYK